MADVLMPSSGPRPRREPSDHRFKAVVLLGSAAMHLAVLAVLATRIIETSAVTTDPIDRPIYVEIEPRPLLNGERARVPTQLPAASSAQTRPLTGPQVVIRAPNLNPEDEDADGPVRPSPRLSAPSALQGQTSTATAGAQGVEAWQVRPETMGDRIGRAYRLGVGGCRLMDGRLSPAEQQRCDNDFNAAAGRARPIGPRGMTPGEARREAEFARDGARALQQYEARRAPLRGGVGVMAPADCVGSNFGIGCAGAHLPDVPNVDMRQGASTNIRQDSNRMRDPD